MKNVHSIVVVSDLHCGCRMGLCPPRVQLDDGGVYRPTGTQRKVWLMWREFWDSFVPKATAGPFLMVVNGDAIDGSHHGATTQISQNSLDQHKIAFMALEPEVKKSAGLYFIRGTESHVGQSGCDEEMLAKTLGAIPNKTGQHARWELWKTLGDNTIHFLHHVSSVGAQRGEANGIHSEMVDLLTETGRWGGKAPSMVVRSHRHRHVLTSMESKHGNCQAFTTAAWQLKTPYCYKVSGARNSTPQIGGHVINLREDGTLEVKTKLWNIERTKPE